AIQTALFCLLTSSSVWVIMLFFFAQYPLGKFSLTWNKLIKRNLGQIRYFKLKYKKTIQLYELETLYNQIVETILSVK
ncbi:MAG: hypothetical protein WCQ44_07330, partial [Opitutaceae bacterium]